MVVAFYDIQKLKVVAKKLEHHYSHTLEWDPSTNQPKSRFQLLGFAIIPTA